jgi:hypothetical protein
MQQQQVVGGAILIAAVLAAACAENTGTMADPVNPGVAGMTASPGGSGAMAGTMAAGTGASGRGAAGTSAGGGGSAAGAGGGGAGVGNAAGASGTGTAGMMDTGEAGMMAVGGAGGAAGAAGMMGGGMGTCCAGGDCLCRPPEPMGLTNDEGPFATDSYDLQGVGCVYYPTDAEPPFAAVAISDGFGGSGGCGRTQTDGWGPFYASYGIVAMIVETGSGDQPGQRGNALLEGIAGFKAENEKSGSPLFGKLAGRYGTSGFSMGGGGTTYAAQEDSTLRTSVGLMAWGPVRSGIMVPSLFICGASDGIASCGAHSEGAYAGISGDTPKAIITVSGGHVGQPSAGGGDSGATALAFQKYFLEGDERWKPILLMADFDDSTIM